VNDAMLDDLLDDLVPKVDQLPDWPSVMQRARRGHRRRVALAIAVAVAAALAVAPALGVLLRGDAVHLPEPADRNNVAVVIAPRSSAIASGAPFTKGRRRRWSRAAFTTMRQTHASRVPSPR
jgi:hypothetical protein